MISVLVSAALGLVFGIAIWSKLRSREALAAFVNGLDIFGLASAARRRLVGIAAVAAEVVAVLLLFLPVPRLFRFGPAAVLIAGFTVAVAVASKDRPSFTCHCFGSAGSTAAIPHVIINGLLISLALAGALAPDPSRTSGDLVLGAGLGLITGTLAVTGVPIAEALRPGSRRS